MTQIKAYTGETHKSKQRIVIIGAGVGGTAAAARLATLGHEVVVLEKNSFGGGRCSLISEKGFRFDQGPSILLMPQIFQETYADLGFNMDDVLDVRKCDTNYKIHFPDNDSLTMTTDLVEMKKEFERVEPGSFEGMVGFFDASECEVWLENESTGLFVGSCRTYFKSDKMKKAFTFQSMYMGMSPYDAPGTYNLLSYSEWADGIHYPVGGFNMVYRGATFQYNTPVKRIDVDSATGLANGVTLENGEQIHADIVVCNQDLVTAYNTLLPKTQYSRSLQSKNQTCSTISFYWGLNQKLPTENFHAHNVFLANEYRPSFDSIFKNNTLPDSPSFYIHIPTRVDPSAAPEGCETLAVLVPTGIITEKTTEQEMKSIHARARAAVIEAVQSRIPGCDDFESWIVTESVNTPFTWEEKFGLWKGSALGLSHDLLQVIYMRPKMRHANYGNLFFVGASTHPGTGVPVVLCGAKLLEEEIETILAKGRASGTKILIAFISMNVGSSSVGVVEA
ncbi:phytoene desaturase [Rhizoclosmatium globosum]|uniref:Phytoene desaturase n=1 Tax=Rhizoclosmatium globosum TaxID=329046 RepID=A0A1Y2BZA6_9FUNG|nr:phytoene desaturase [Rhizoclosmatium globosum]|eukprot:ORY40098.1 phytoene desaturase [Rhizoclosmatium globosum]